MKNKSCLLTSYLKSLGVRYTFDYAKRAYEEHPHKYNLYGLSLLLGEYNIETKGLRIEKKDLAKLEPPFIAQTYGTLVVVTKMADNKVSYLWNELELELEIEEFIKQWTGVVLLAEKTNETVEPNYIANKRKQIYKNVSKGFLIAAILFLSIYLFSAVGHSYDFRFLSLLFTNLAGVYVCYMLLKKQLNIKSNNADKICSLFKQGDCNNVIESEAAKLFGIFSWSEVGLGYFGSNIVILLYFPELLPYSALINVIALPYTVWSVWYQKVRAKQWCVLCLIVQALLWVVFIINLASGAISIPLFSLMSISILASVYAIPYLLISIITPIYTNNTKKESLINEYNSIRMNDDVFLTLLKKEQRYSVDITTSAIIFGNPNAKMLITILTNPHCNPCAKMHERVEKLIAKTGDQICVQYIFSSFNEELEESVRCLIKIYNDYAIQETTYIYSEWYIKGKDDKQSFYDKYSKGEYDDKSLAEFEKHIKWKEESKLSATPTIFVNGYTLPKEYKIEDLEYFTDLDIRTK